MRAHQQLEVEQIGKSFPGVKALTDVGIVFRSGQVHDQVIDRDRIRRLVYCLNLAHQFDFMHLGGSLSKCLLSQEQQSQHHHHTYERTQPPIRLGSHMILLDFGLIE